ncbi:MAG: DsbA family protein, partial [Nitrosopumilus sp.]|nr:DsbA family protein [Nitrosopumilus sp.]
MAKLYLLTIPIIIGIATAMFLVSYSESDNDSLTSSKLIGKGSPFLGDANAPITVLEWGDYQCTFC